MEYDEDLASNPFLKFIQQHYSFLYEEAVKQQWILCIPSVNSLRPDQFDELYVRQHLILQEGEISRTLTNEPVQFIDDWIKFGATSVRILFRETFYTKAGKVRALCVNKEDASLNHIKSPTILQKKLIRDSIKAVKSIVSTSMKTEEFFNHQEKMNENLMQIKNLILHLDRKISSCVIYNVYTQLIEFITVQTSKSDENLNKMRRNNYEIKPNEFSFPETFYPSLENALSALDNLPHTKLAADKLDCIRQTVNLLTKTDIPTELDADNLLALLSYLIVKSEVNNWTAQLQFIKIFHNASLLGEDGYLISTLEAVLDHLQQGNFNSQLKSKDPSNKPLFQAAIKGDADSLTELLSNAQFKCHPLCSCHACGLPMIVDPLETDSNGWTALHFASYYGHSDAVQVLLKTSFRDNVQRVDTQGRTALHWAAFRGNQTCLLLLCHQVGCDLNCRDLQGDSPLHLAAMNGHESCVKALLYYSEQAHYRLNIDGVNQNGETALHLAAKWGYGTIVQLLLQWEANARILNKHKKDAADVAQNVKISKAIFKFYGEEGQNFKLKGTQGKFWTGITRQLSLRQRSSIQYT